MTDTKKTAFDRATESSKAEIVDDEDGEVRSNVPRAVFTKDATLDMSKLQIGSLRIAQGMTAEVTDRKAQLGQFVLTNFPAKDEVILVPLGATNIRAYKPDPKKPALCHAPTGDFGFGNPGGVCAECPLGNWGEYDEVKKKSAPPKCKEGILLRAYSITHRSVVDFQFMGGDARSGSFIQMQGLSFGWGAFCIKLTSKVKSNDRGSWYIPEIEMLEDVPEEQKEIVAKWLEIFLSSQVDSKAEALRQLSAGDA